MGALLIAILCAIGTVPAAAEHAAPLDTLETPPTPVTGASLAISRNVLPDVSTTIVPRSAPPRVPPRLDDPTTGDRLFRTARHAAAQGLTKQAEVKVKAALNARPGDSRIPMWQVTQALRNRDPGAFVWHLPGALRSVIADPLAIPRLAIQAHQAAVLLLAVFWSFLVAAGLAAWWRPLAHDMSALLFRDPDHRLRNWMPWLLVFAIVMARPGWLGGLALFSLILLLQARGRSRTIFVTTWVLALILTFPNWPWMRDCVAVIDPASETTLLVRAGQEAPSTQLIQELRERLASAEDPARQLRLRQALGLQEARRGRFSASNEQFRAVLDQSSDNLTSVVGMANNSYFTSRYDEALAGYLRAREIAPDRGEIPYNQAQVYFKKLFVPEAGHALEDARRLGFDPPVEQEGTQGEQNYSPAVYLSLSREDLKASAHSEAANYPPLAWLASWNYFLGSPPLPLFIVLAGLFTAGVILAYWGGVVDEIRTCESCGNEICRSCCVDRGGALICRDCNETADRSRSEMVLATLLKNRSRTVGLATTARLALLARLLPGAAHLAIGENMRALSRLALMALAVYLIGFGWAFDPAAAWASPGLSLAEETVHPVWLPLPASGWCGLLGWPVLAGWVLLALVYSAALIDGTKLRLRLPERFVQCHGGPATGQGPA